ncbi:MAG: hypothetical protein SGJ27_22350 [Candidatus Melainabacteria bacterium]|nr:hypothetical protein [Candidatus Melainabacteria bacterium]
MSQNTRLLLIALVVMVVFGIFLQSLIARSLQESNGNDVRVNMPKLPSSRIEPLPGIEAVPGAAPPPPSVKKVDRKGH